MRSSGSEEGRDHTKPLNPLSTPNTLETVGVSDKRYCIVHGKHHLLVKTVFQG